MQYILFLAMAPTAAVISLAIAGYALRHRQVPGAFTLALYMLAVSGFLITDALELLWPTERGTLFWAQLKYLFIAILPLAWLSFAFQYAGKESWLSLRSFGALAVIPATTFILAMTNSSHRLIWQTYSFHPVGDMLALHISHGPWFWIHTFYTYLLFLGGAGLIFSASFSAPRLYRRELLWEVGGVLVFLVVNLTYILHIIPGWQKNYTSLALALGGIIFAAGIFRYRMLGLVPAARAALVEQMQDGVIVVDGAERIIDVNPAARRILGLEEDQLGMSLGSAFPECTETPRFTAETQVIRCTGQGISFLELQISPLKNSRGRMTGWLVMVRDITAQVRAEETLRELNRELQVRNEELDAFGHTVAHDLKNPLGIVIGFAELLSDDTAVLSRAERNRSLQGLLRNARRLDRIIDELMLLAGLRKMDVPMERLDMGKIVAIALDRLGPMIKDAKAMVILPPSWPTALGYAPWVEEVWMNYISNAVKYGGSPPQMELGATVQEDHTVRFWIHDSGPGLTAEQQERLFQPFERLGNLRVTGHGLGLSIVRRMVERMNGTVGVESSGIPGEGSTFSFTLPAPVAA